MGMGWLLRKTRKMRRNFDTTVMLGWSSVETFAPVLSVLLCPALHDLAFRLRREASF